MVRMTLLCSVTALDRSPYDTHTGKQTEGRRRGETRLKEKRTVTGRMTSSHKRRTDKGSEIREDLINQIRSDQIRSDQERSGHLGSVQC
jgi:predicted small metal-binding protein